MLKKIIVTIFLIFAGLLRGPVPGLAATFNWVGGNGNWREAGNWEPAVIPGQNDTAIIDNGHTVAIPDYAFIHQLEVGSTSALNIGSSTTAFLIFENVGPDSYIRNYGTIRVGAGSGYPGSINSSSPTLTLQGDGSLILGGPGNSFYGNGAINTAGHTIRGGGNLVLSANQGQVIADNGTLWITGGPLDNTGGVMSASGSGNVLKIYYLDIGLTGGAINPQDGKVNITNAFVGNITFGPGAVEIGTNSNPGNVCQLINTVILDSGTMVTIRPDSSIVAEAIPNTSTLVNNGAIFMSSNGVDHPAHVGGVILQGTGTLTMEGAGNDVEGIVNTASHTIQGGGSIMGGTNDGAIIANNKTLTISGLTGTGTITAADEATLAVTGDWSQIGDLTLSHQANLTVNINPGWSWFDLQRNFAFFQTDPAKWSWASGDGLMIRGQGPWQTIEVGSQNFGAIASGLTNNFALPQLWVNGTGTRVKLVDLIDNGHRVDGHEALYVTALVVDPETTLELNGLKLYAYLDTEMHRVRGGEGTLFGGGKIIDSGASLSAVNLLLLD